MIRFSPLDHSGDGHRLSPPITDPADLPEGAAPCYTRQSLAAFMQISLRSLDRAAALGLLPRPDLVVGRSPRWSPATVAGWMRTRPRLPGRSTSAPLIVFAAFDVRVLALVLVAVVIAYVASRTGKGAQHG